MIMNYWVPQKAEISEVTMQLIASQKEISSMELRVQPSIMLKNY
jgi:hypothetical protein